MPHKTVTATIYREASICFIPVNFDPKAAFGKIRAPRKGHIEPLHLPQHHRLDGRIHAPRYTALA
jgi:hypothetical protein